MAPKKKAEKKPEQKTWRNGQKKDLPRPTGKRKQSCGTPKPKVHRLEKSSFDQCTELEKRFLHELFGEADFNASEAMIRASGKYTSRNAARVDGCLMYKALRPVIASWLDDAGLSENHLKHKLLRMLEAKETKFFAHEGVVITEREVDALGIQMDALKTAMKSKGMLSDKSTREVDQIDELIRIELAKLAASGQGAPTGTAEKTDKPDQAPS